MTEYLTAEGLKVLRLADIKAELEQAYRDAFGAGTVLTPDTVLGKILGIQAEREVSIWELLEAIYGASYPGTASGVSLDRIGEITGIARNAATRSQATVYLAGTPSTVIPAGTLIGVVDSGVRFQLKAQVTLGPIGTKSITALTRSGGTATATCAAHGLLVGNWVFISGADQAEYNGLKQVLTVPDANTFTYAVSGTPATPAAGTIELAGTTPAEAESVDSGPVQALAGTLKDIVNGISGWDRVDNATDAALGRNEETDAEFRERRLAALAGLGAAHNEAIRGALLALTGVTQAKIFENDTDATVNGRPPHSFEALVVGGADQDIRDSLWADKAAGIATHGGVSGTVMDSQGDQHTVKFSRPTQVNIWVELDITDDPLLFPANGATLIRDRVLAWGDALEIGEDVIVYPYLLASFDDVPGIVDVAVRIGTAPSPTLDNNIVIAETEIADFDTSRITVTLL